MTAPLRIIVTGTRNAEVQGYDVGAHIESWYGGERLPPMTVVHGGSGNVDVAADRWARWSTFPSPHHPEPHHADWKTHGKKARPIRNSEMAKAGADLCLAFWDGKSRGTLDMITKAVRHGIPVRIVPVEVAG